MVLDKQRARRICGIIKMRRLNRMCLAVGATVLLTSSAAWALGGTVASPVSPDVGLIRVQYADPGFGGPYGGPYANGMGGYPGQGQGFRGGPGQQGRAAFPTGRYVVYHGFKIDVGEAEGRVDVPSALTALDHQIDIVDRSGLSASLLQTFRSVPIRISVTFTGSGGHYKGGQEVVMGSLAANDDRPVLLHEYMHVMHYKRFPGGFQNPTIRHFYEEAMARNLYPAGSYMLTNPAEFFAMTASCYLNGTVARPPYDRATIRNQQPDYYAYLGQLFGRAGNASLGEGTSVLAATR